MAALNRIHGHRARIGYTVAAVTTEVFPIDWYRVVPDGVSLMMITLPLGDRSAEDVAKCYDISLEAAHTMARAGADLVLLGGLPINISKGDDTVEGLMDKLAGEIGVKMSCSALAQVRAFAALGSKKVAVAHPFLADQNPRHERTIENFFGLECVGVHAGGSNLVELGKLTPESALQWGRAAKQAYPDADTLYFGCPHWTVIDAIQPLEDEFGVSVMTSLQAIAWDAMRQTGVNDSIAGFGRLLAEN
jgi:maleate cis-trans isomerase